MKQRRIFLSPTSSLSNFNYKTMRKKHTRDCVDGISEMSRGRKFLQKAEVDRKIEVNGIFNGFPLPSAMIRSRI